MMVPQITQVVDYQKNALNNHLQLQGILVISVCFWWVYLKDWYLEIHWLIIIIPISMAI